MSHIAALGDMFFHKAVATVVCLGTAPKINNSDHIFSLSKAFPCKADATEHMQE